MLLDLTTMILLVGYVLVSLMLRLTQGLSVADAVTHFARNRPPGIYKEDYIQSLFDYYHERRCCTPAWLSQTIRSSSVPRAVQGSGALVAAMQQCLVSSWLHEHEIMQAHVSVGRRQWGHRPCRHGRTKMRTLRGQKTWKVRPMILLASAVPQHGRH